MDAWVVKKFRGITRASALGMVAAMPPVRRLTSRVRV
ncbi:MAG: hypothetical protein H6Q00_3070 [Holophagaceae bacterium]|nr:hypothetical protein [Holophagaceae bacterium]